MEILGHLCKSRNNSLRSYVESWYYPTGMALKYASKLANKVRNNYLKSGGQLLDNS